MIRLQNTNPQPPALLVPGHVLETGTAEKTEPAGLVKEASLDAGAGGVWCCRAGVV
jgi:hypothetical protein